MKRFVSLLFVLFLSLVPCMEPLCRLTASAEDIPFETDSTVIESDEEARTLVLNDMGPDVKELQTHLAELGYYSGQITRRYGETTKSAVSAFQKDFGLEESGQADSTTQALVFATLYRPLHVGSSGTDVTRLQTRLTILGYYTGKITGVYLDATSEAVSAFQVKMGLTATGEADSDTQGLIYSSDARSRSGAAVITPEPERDSEIVDGNNPDAIETVAYKKRLAYGSSGKNVKLLQQRLTDLGYYEGPVSGNFQGNTRNAVKAFQTQNGLKVDGVVGKKTWDLLFNTASIVLPGDTPVPAATPEPVPFHITVDVTNQVVTVYSRDAEGEYTVVVRQMICSSGTKKNPSSIGDFTLNGRKARWCFFPKWGDYAQYWTQITSEIAFHSVIYARVDTKSLSIKSYNMLGQRASHGCIRLLVSDAKWIYDNVGKGTVVTITEDLPADPELRASVAKPSLNKKNMLPVETPQPTAEPVYISGAEPPLPLEKLQKNNSSEAVYWMQKKLTELGYYSGKCSGTYLAGTIAAVKAFQKANGLRQTGTADVKTLEVLYAQELASPIPIETPAPQP